MNKSKEKYLESELIQSLKARNRLQWFREYEQWKGKKEVVEICRMLNISRSTFYYWKTRYEQVKRQLWRGRRMRPSHLRDISRKPKYSPKMYPEEIIELIMKIRKRTRYGAERIWLIMQEKYGHYLSVTGIYKTLKRNGVIVERRKRGRKRSTYERPTYLPGQLVQMDTKHLKLASGQKVYQFTAKDCGTGLKAKRIYRGISPENTVDFVGRLIVFFPFKIQTIQTDNGTEFTYRLNPLVPADIEHPLDTYCRLRGIAHTCIPPGLKAKQNIVERTHRTDDEECYRKKTFWSLYSIQKACYSDMIFYNQRRRTKNQLNRTLTEIINIKFGLNPRKINYRVLNV